jgi:hypothetical protein
MAAFLWLLDMEKIPLDFGRQSRFVGDYIVGSSPPYAAIALADENAEKHRLPREVHLKPLSTG